MNGHGERVHPGMETDVELSSDDRDLVLGSSLYDDTLVILPRRVAEHLGALYEALGSSTWGELRGTASAEIYAEILGQAGYGSLDEYMARFDVGRPVPGAEAEGLRQFAAKQGEPIPADDEPFDADSDIGGYGDGDFPPAPQLSMLEVLPRDVIEKFGNVYETIFNGTFVQFPAADVDEITAALERDGYRCTFDQALIAGTQRE